MTEAVKAFVHLERCLMVAPDTPNFLEFLQQCLDIQMDAGSFEASYYLQETVDGLQEEVDSLRHSLDKEWIARVHAEHLLRMEVQNMESFTEE